MAQETEIKLSVPNADVARSRLRELGFEELRPRAFESNELWDFPGAVLRSRGELIRLRHYAGENVLTYKGPAQPGAHKSREEIETTFGSAEAVEEIFSRLGLSRGFRYEKYRTEFHRPPEPGHATLDETPIGVFLELEGDPEWIDRTAAKLGFKSRDYILLSYAGLYLEHCRQHEIEPAHMVFPPK